MLDIMLPGIVACGDDDLIVLLLLLVLEIAPEDAAVADPVDTFCPSEPSV